MEEQRYTGKPEKPGFISNEDYAFAQEVLALVPGSFLGGSFLVKGMGAKDIDIVIPHARWPEARKALSGRIRKVLHELPTEMEDRGEPGDDRLVTVYRRGAVDLLVIRDEFVRSYEKACEAMTADPESYQEREARVAIHIYYADEYRREAGMPPEMEATDTTNIFAIRQAYRSGKASGGDYPS